MATNTVTIQNTTNVYVNDIYICTCESASSAITVKTALTNIVTDEKRDLDFITPTYIESLNQYAVCCPLVRADQGEYTYFYNDNHTRVARKLYEDTNYGLDFGKATRTLIYLIPTSVSAPWHEAFTIANRIRYAVTPHYNCLRTGTEHLISRMQVPSNTSTTVGSIISANCSCQFYGHPEQGKNQGTSYWSDVLQMTVENISSPVTANGDVFHPQDLTAAVTADWGSAYLNRYVKVTNLSTSKSIVVRITDRAPAGKGIELSWRAYSALGRPTNAKVELMN